MTYSSPTHPSYSIGILKELVVPLWLFVTTYVLVIVLHLANMMHGKCVNPMVLPYGPWFINATYRFSMFFGSPRTISDIVCVLLAPLLRQIRNC